MRQTPSEVRRYGADWDFKRKKVLRRDDYTCQRCGHQSGPHAGDEGRVLQAHHINKVSDGGSNELSNLRTLCQPCHGVQHPDNHVFDGVRPLAAIYPSQFADSSVAYVNSNQEREPLEAYLERKNRDHCQRCGNASDDSWMYVYPNIYFDKLDEYTNPGEKFGVLCGPCAGLVYDSDTDDNVKHELYRTDGKKVDQEVDLLVELKNQAQISGANKTRKFNATRDPVNQKEQFLFKSPYRFLHAWWRGLGSLLIAVVLFLFSEPYQEQAVTSVTAVNGIGPISGEFFVTGAAVIASISLAFMIRWSISGLSDVLWNYLDDSIEPHHFSKQKMFTLRRRLKLVGKYLGLPYVVLVGFQLLVVF